MHINFLSIKMKEYKFFILVLYNLLNINKINQNNSFELNLMFMNMLLHIYFRSNKKNHHIVNIYYDYMIHNFEYSYNISNFINDILVHRSHIVLLYYIDHNYLSHLLYQLIQMNLE